MTDDNQHNRFSLRLWRLFFDVRAVGLTTLAVTVLVPGVPLDPRLAILTIGVALPVTLVLRELAAQVRTVPWIVPVIDSALLAVSITIDPSIAPATGILLMASTSVAATAGWRPTVLANFLGSPLMIIAMARYAPDDLLLVMSTFLITSTGVAVFVSVIAGSERHERQHRDELLDGIDAVLWEAHPYPFVSARLTGRTEDLLGLSIDELSGPGGWLDRLPAFDRAHVVAQSRAAIDRGEDHELTYRVTGRDGEVLHVRDRVRVEVDAAGRPVTARGIVVDITDEVRVHETNRNLAELVERVPVGLLVARADKIGGATTFTTVTVNPAYEALAGLDATALVNTSVSGALKGPGRDDVRRILLETLNTGQPQRLDEARDLGVGGDRVLSLEAFSISEGLVGLNVVDVTELVTTAKTLRRQALHDALTGLPNRTLLEDRLRHAVAAASRDHKSVALLLLDLDQFKDVNDTLGHDEGDRLLQMVAARIRDTMRTVDTVARLGGDEFAVLLTDDVSPRRSLRAAERVLSCFEEPMHIDGMALQCGASLGVAIYPDHVHSADELRKHADIAMYEAKRRGGGVAVYDAERDRHDIERLTLVGQLNEAISGDELVLHYQPAVDLATGAVDRVEALVRWNHAERGLIEPDQFIDLAEVSGLIRPLTQWVIGRAITDIAALRNEGHELGVSINISVRNLYEPGLVDSIRSRLESADLPGHHITLELTETQVMDDPVLARGVLGRLGLFGVRSSVDDFGTGHSSLSNLQSLPVSEVKIDRSFVQAMAAGDEAAATIVRSIVSLGHNLGLEVVAEGVETNEAMTRLSLFGCDRGQGHLFGRAMPRAELAAYLQVTQRGAVV